MAGRIDHPVRWAWVASLALHGLGVAFATGVISMVDRPDRATQPLGVFVVRLGRPAARGSDALLLDSAAAVPPAPDRETWEPEPPEAEASPCLPALNECEPDDKAAATPRRDLAVVANAGSAPTAAGLGNRVPRVGDHTPAAGAQPVATRVGAGAASPKTAPLAAHPDEGAPTRRRGPAVAGAPTAARTAAAAAGNGDATTAAAPLGSVNQPPAYPRAARRAGWEGTVLVAVLVGADGGCRRATVAASSGHPVLDQAALEAVRGWRFSPALRAGAPVESEVEVPVVFRLR